MHIHCNLSSDIFARQIFPNSFACQRKQGDYDEDIDFATDSTNGFVDIFGNIAERLLLHTMLNHSAQNGTVPFEHTVFSVLTV